MMNVSNAIKRCRMKRFMFSPGRQKKQSNARYQRPRIESKTLCSLPSRLWKPLLCVCGLIDIVFELRELIESLRSSTAVIMRHVFEFTVMKHCDFCCRSVSPVLRTIRFEDRKTVG